jgi:hypothetical protein
MNTATLKRRSPPLLLVTLLITAALIGPSAARASSAKKNLTVYAVPTTVQFMNHADDRLRGMATNPFNQAKAIVITAGSNEKQGGPFPGDDVLYSFRLYTSPEQKKEVGAAVFTCYDDFLKHAVCQAYFDLNAGVVLASGSVAFNNPHFILSVTGGTRTFLGALGQVNSVPARKNAQRFDLALIGLQK